MMMSTRFTSVAMTVLASPSIAIQVKTDDLDQLQDEFNTLQNELDQAKDSKNFSEAHKVLNKMQELKPYEEVKMPRLSKFHEGDVVDVRGFRCNESCLNGLVGRLVRAQDYENMSWIIKFHAEDQTKVPLTDKILKVISEQTSRFASEELKNETKNGDAMAIHEENMKNTMHVGDKVILGRYKTRFDKQLNGLVGVVTRAHEHQCWIVQIQEADSLSQEVRQMIKDQTSGRASAEFKAEMANGDKLSVHESNMKKASILQDAQHPRVIAMQKMHEAEKAMKKA